MEEDEVQETGPAYEVDLSVLEETTEALALTAEDSLAIQTETLVHLGNMEGYALFGVVVVLCIFVYKFFRMFF